MNIKIIIISIVIALGGCSSSPPIKSERLTRSFTFTETKAQLVELPKIGEIFTIEIGESLTSKFHKIETPAIEVLESYTFKTSNLGKELFVTIEAGKFVSHGKDDSGIFYKPLNGKTYISTKEKNKGTEMSGSGVYVSNGSSDVTEYYVLTKDGRPLNYEAPNIKIKKYFSEKISEESFKKELVYTGVSKNIITVLYREYNEGVARPAFTQELKYDLGEGKVVGFKGARFEVIKATNTGLTYKATSHLN